MPTTPEPYYRPALARVHHEGFGVYGNAVAPGVLALLEPTRAISGLVVELGCGSGILTRHLVAAGHRVVATDASPAMLDVARSTVPSGADIRQLTLPDDAIPEADAIVAVGHPLNYLPDTEAIEAAIVAMAGALRPGGIVVFDLCDRAYGELRRDAVSRGWVGTDWALVTRFSAPAPDRFVREMTIFTRNADGAWSRDDERHDNVLVDTSTIPGLFASLGVHASIRSSFGSERLPDGMVAIVGTKQ